MSTDVKEDLIDEGAGFTCASLNRRCDDCESTEGKVMSTITPQVHMQFWAKETTSHQIYVNIYQEPYIGQK